ncbi:MAG: ATP-grasp domain-containing protein [Deltaproteobacteria bacterium]|nr:ATP-grasp domain-containing protein [Deltaproteobacteria bacterium]
MNSLFTSVGRRVELLRAFRRAYQALRLPGRIVGLDSDPLAPALRFCDRRYVVPRTGAPGYLPRLVEICQREEIGLVFALIDPDIPFLAAQRAPIEATGARLAVVPAAAAEICADKWLTWSCFQRAGIPVPRSWLPGDPELERQALPLFIKPRRGSASHHAFMVRTREELRFFSHYVSEPIVQQLLPGPEITSDVACDLQGNVLGVVSRRRIEVRGGEVSKGVTVRDERILEACARVARELGAVGPITVQCLMDGDTPRFTEVNARFGGGAPLGIAAGVDSPRWLLARAAGMEIDLPPLGSYQVGLYLSRFDDSLLLTDAERTPAPSGRL